MSKAKRKSLKLAADNTFHFNDYVVQRKTVTLVPKTINQETYIKLLTDESKPIVYASGPAGTGKTMLAVLAGIKAYKEGRVEKLVLTRPAVEVAEERHGFLPGDLVSKMEPWTRPILDVMMEYYSPKEITRMIDEQHIEISPLAFMRGRNFKRCWLIADEMQNATPSQLKMLLTRLGDGSKIVITGDLNQTDKRAAENGLMNFLSLLDQYGSAQYVAGIQFAGRDIQRHPAVKEILGIYRELT